MGILNDLLRRVEAVNEGLQTGATVREVVITHEADIMELQKMQLLAGKSSSGEDLRPYYSEDLQPGGYFKSGASAKAYADWKGTITYPYSVQRNPDAPNLYVNGKFHSEIGVQFGTDSMEVVATTAYAHGIMLKYGPQNFGLSGENWGRLFEMGAYDELMNELRTRLYGN